MERALEGNMLKMMGAPAGIKPARVHNPAFMADAPPDDRFQRVIRYFSGAAEN
jgi:hypothetical protein